MRRRQALTFTEFRKHFIGKVLRFFSTENLCRRASASKLGQRKKQGFSAEPPLYRSSRNYMQPISVAQVAVVRPHRLPTLTSTVNRFGQDAADEGIGFEILFNPGLVQVEANLLGQAANGVSSGRCASE